MRLCAITVRQQDQAWRRTPIIDEARMFFTDIPGVFVRRDMTKTKKDRPVFGPCSLKQKLILQDNTTDVILMGG